MMRAASTRNAPPQDFLLGHFPDFSRDRLRFFLRCAREHGDFVPLRLGYRRVCLINHPDLIESVLIDNHKNYIKHQFFWKQVRGIFGLGLVNSEDALWQLQRRLIQPAFQRERLESYVPEMVEYAIRYLNTWPIDQRFDLHRALVHVTLSIVTKTLLDTALAERTPAIADLINRAMQLVEKRIRVPVRIPDFVPTPINRAYAQVVRQFDELSADIVKAHSASSNPGFLLTTLWAEHGRDHPERVRDEIVTALIAGHETTALLLVWTVYALSAHPDVEARLVEECRSVLGDREPNYSDYERLPYTRQVLSEVLRLYPPIYAIARQPRTACTIGEHPVEPGTTVFMSQWAMHRDPRFYDEPERFDPDRWSDARKQRIPRYAYFPFGIGPRHCVGMNFALIEAALLLAVMVTRYRFRIVEPVEPRASITLRPHPGLFVSVNRR